MLPGISLFLPRQSTPGSQTFSTAGTFSFTVPLYTTMTIEIWGGGGSGGNGYNGGGAGGGGDGGNYRRFTVATGGLIEGSTETVVVGAGGTGVTGYTNGNGGGFSQFGNSITAAGGRGGRAQDSSGNAGGTYTPTNPRPAVFTQTISENGGTGGYGAVNGGSVTYAGGGGGGMVNDYGQGNGGTSTFGGKGGNGGDATENQPRNASAPAGGGGSTDWDGGSPSGNGGTGRIVISWT